MSARSRRRRRLRRAHSAERPASPVRRASCRCLPLSRPRCGRPRWIWPQSSSCSRASSSAPVEGNGGVLAQSKNAHIPRGRRRCLERAAKPPPPGHRRRPATASLDLQDDGTERHVSSKAQPSLLTYLLHTVFVFLRYPCLLNKLAVACSWMPFGPALFQGLVVDAGAVVSAAPAP